MSQIRILIPRLSKMWISRRVGMLRRTVSWKTPCAFRSSDDQMPAILRTVPAVHAFRQTSDCNVRLRKAADHGRKTAHGSDGAFLSTDGFEHDSVLHNLFPPFSTVHNSIPHVSTRFPLYPQSVNNFHPQTSSANPQSYPHYSQVFHTQLLHKICPFYDSEPAHLTQLRPFSSLHRPSHRKPAYPACG